MPRCPEPQSDVDDDDEGCSESGEEKAGSDNASNTDRSHVGQAREVAQTEQTEREAEDSGTLGDGDATLSLACVEIEQYVVHAGCVRRLVMHMVDASATGDDAKRFEVIECVSSDAAREVDTYKHMRFADIQDAVGHLRGDCKSHDTNIAVGTKNQKAVGNTRPALSSKPTKRKYDQLSRKDTEKVTRAGNTR